MQTETITIAIPPWMTDEARTAYRERAEQIKAEILQSESELSKADSAEPDLRPLRITFRMTAGPHGDLVIAYYRAAPEAICNLTKAFATFHEDNRQSVGGAYDVLTMDGEPRTLALHFADVLYIN